MIIKLFAYLGETLGPEIELLLSEPISKASVLEEVAMQYPMAKSDILLCNVAVNQRYLMGEERILSEDIQEMALIPPVSGG